MQNNNICAWTLEEHPCNSKMVVVQAYKRQCSKMMHTGTQMEALKLYDEAHKMFFRDARVL